MNMNLAHVRRCLPLLLLLGTALLALPSGSALALTVPVAQDTSSSPAPGVAASKQPPLGVLTSKDGTATTLSVSTHQVALLQFDLSYEDVVPNTVVPANVQSALLLIYVVKTSTNADLTIHAVTSPWTEAFKTATEPVPTISSTVLATIPASALPPSFKGYVSVDVTGPVVAALQSGSNLSFAVESSSTTSRVITSLGSKDGPSAGYPAQLDIEAGFGGLSGILSDSNANGSVSFFAGTPQNGLSLAGTVTANGAGPLLRFINSAGTGFSDIGEDGSNDFVIRTDGTTQLTIQQQGNVGIGVTLPAYPLDINGGASGVRISSAAQTTQAAANPGSSLILENDASMGTHDWLLAAADNGTSGAFALPGAFVIADATAKKTRFLIDSSGAVFIGGLAAAGGSPGALNVNGPGTFTGDVGIGTTAPAANLEITGSNGTRAIIREATNYFAGVVDQNSLHAYFTGINTGDSSWCVYDNSNNVQRLTVATSGYVGIGTTSPTYPLDVEASGTAYTGALLWSYAQAGNINGSSFTNEFSGSPNLSIYTNGGIGCTTAYFFSDARIKHIQGLSDAASDLATLRKIAVTDYTYIDTVVKGAGKQKKVIAQQVEKVYPQAVSSGTDVVPDIFKMAPIHDGWVELATDLKVGDRVRLITEDGAQAVHTVLEVAQSGFRTDFKPTGTRVFVYGREVNDFRSVDYDAIAMLNVSATQELARRLEADDAEISALKNKVDALEAADKARGERLARIEARLAGEENPVRKVAYAPEAYK